MQEMARNTSRGKAQELGSGGRVRWIRRLSNTGWSGDV